VSLKWKRGIPPFGGEWRKSEFRSEEIVILAYSSLREAKYIVLGHYYSKPYLTNEKVSHWVMSDDGDGRWDPRIADEDVLGYLTLDELINLPIEE
jgi:hypothetical protein